MEGSQKVGIVLLKEHSQKCTGGVENVLSQFALLLIMRELYESDSVCITTMPVFRFAVVLTIAL